MTHKIFDMPFARIYPLYVAKVTKKGRSVEELNELIFWLTGHNEDSIKMVIDQNISNQDFFHHAPRMHPLAHQVKGNICGVRVETIEDPMMRNIRILDKLVDDCAKGKALEKILPKE